MTAQQILAAGVAIWIPCIVIIFIMICRPVTEKSYRRMKEMNAPWFWLDLFVERTKDNLTKFIRTGGFIGLAMLIVITIVVLVFCDWRQSFQRRPSGGAARCIRGCQQTAHGGFHQMAKPNTSFQRTLTPAGFGPMNSNR